MGKLVTHETVMNLYPKNVVSTSRIRNPICIITHEIDDVEDDNNGDQKTIEYIFSLLLQLFKDLVVYIVVYNQNQISMLSYELRYF